MDEFAVMSHLRVLEAQRNKFFEEVVPIFSSDGVSFEKDDGVRGDSAVEKLAQLKPFFDKKFGSVTAGNSSQVTDGAAMLLLASEDMINKYQLPVLAKVVDMEWAGLSPGEMGLGPVHSSTPLLLKRGLSMSDIDYWEINEAFAAQVLGCVAAWNDDDYCKNYLGLEGAFGALDLNRVNIDGGGIAQGHPVGASGARILLHLAHVLKRKKAKYGVATLCVGGGQGGAVLIENMTGE